MTHIENSALDGGARGPPCPAWPGTAGCVARPGCIRRTRRRAGESAKAVERCVLRPERVSEHGSQNDASATCWSMELGRTEVRRDQLVLRGWPGLSRSIAFISV